MCSGWVSDPAFVPQALLSYTDSEMRKVGVSKTMLHDIFAEARISQSRVGKKR